ncbi:hypothetical protein [Natronorubrum sp. FCH18a]|uniref:hypothetical protein n=1 Tax=Natronorubrum sp. FCH18a TaxID=3447018 RepID=UPI003F512762
MNGLDDVPDTVYRVIFSGIVLYFALLVYGQVAGDSLAAFAAEFVFGVIAVGVGTILYLQAETDRGSWVIPGAAVCLVLGGAFQFAFLFTRNPALDQVSSIVVFVGIGLYIYAVWYAD